MTWPGWENYIPSTSTQGGLGACQPHSRQPIRNKFNAESMTIEGVRFASRKEAQRYQDLILRQHAGDIDSLLAHPAYELVVNGIRVGRYTADFYYVTSEGEAIVEDVKGGRATKTEAYSLRRRLFEACHYPLTVTEV